MQEIRRWRLGLINLLYYLFSWRVMNDVNIKSLGWTYIKKGKYKNHKEISNGKIYNKDYC